MADPTTSPAPPSEDALPEVKNEHSQSDQLDASYITQPTTDQPASSDVEMSNAPPTQTHDPSDADLDASLAAEPNANEPDADEPDANGAQPSVPHIDGASDPPPQTSSASNLPPVIAPEPTVPAKKDSTLRAFLANSDNFTPLIPDAVTDYYLTSAGLPPPPETDRRLARLLALATQKFIADIAADAYQYSRIRSTNTTSNNPLTGLGGAAGFGMGGIPAAGGGDGEGGGAGGGKKAKDAGKAGPIGGPRAGYGGGGAGAGQGRTVLTMEDLGMAVGEYGVNVKRGEFYR